jgi:hypothetical protein
MAGDRLTHPGLLLLSSPPTSRRAYPSGVPGSAEFGRCCGWGSASGVGRSGVPCESPQPGRSAVARGDSALRCPAAGILAWVKDKYLALRSAKGRGWLVRQGGLQARRGDPGLDQVQEDPTDLGGIGDDGKHLHGGAAAAAVKCVYLVDLGQQPRPSRTRFPSGDGLLGTILEDRL